MLLAFAFSPAAASALTYYASHGGTGDACTTGNPCLLDTALNLAHAEPAEDAVQILGAFERDTLGTAIDLTTSPVDLVGSGRGAGGTRIFNSTGYLVSIGTGSSVRDLRLEAGAEFIGATPISMKPGAEILDSTLVVGDRGAKAILFDGTGTEVGRIRGSTIDAVKGTLSAFGQNFEITDSTLSGVVWHGTGTLLVQRSSILSESSGLDLLNGDTRVSSTVIEAYYGSYVGEFAGGGETPTADFRQTTFQWQVNSSGPSNAGTYGVYVHTGGDATFVGSVARGFGDDMRCDAGSLTISHSYFETDGATAPSCYHPGEGNIRSGDPQFANQAGGDYSLLATSPLVDRGQPGAAAPDESATDRGGSERVRDGNGDGSALRDIGAFEYQPPSPAGPLAPPVLDTTAPVVGSLAMSRRRFAVGSAATPLAAARRRTPRGTSFRFSLSEAGSVRIVVERRATGRKVGRACRKQTRRNRGRRRCTLWLRQGTLRRARPAGRAAIAFSGRLGRKALKRGSYRAGVSAVDAAGNASIVRRVTFAVVRR